MKYLFFCIIAILTSCAVEKQANEVFSIGVEIFASDSKGANLFLSSTQNSIKPDSIRLLYPINGKNHTVYDANMDCPTGICYLNDAGKERIGFTPNFDENEEYPITYIRWESGDLDTVKCHFIRKESDTNSSIVCDKVWFNNSLMFPDKAIKGFDRAFKIVK